MKVLSFGEILWDVYPDEKFIGGAPFNFAAHLARHGERVWMLSALGNDPLGEAAKQHLRILGVSDDYVSVLEEMRTGQCLVTLDEKQIPSYLLLPDVAYDRISCRRVPDEFDVLYFGTLALRSEYNLRSLKELLESHSFHEVFVDINLRPPFYSPETVRFAMEKASILKLSLEECPAVAELLGLPSSTDHPTIGRSLAAGYPNLKCVLITLGPDGAYAWDPNAHREYSCGSQQVEVRSTVGAGDSFSAAFLHKYAGGTPLPACLEYAARVAAFVVSQYDAVPYYDPR